MATDNTQAQDTPKISYFMPNQFLVLVEHNDGLEAGLIREYLRSFDVGSFNGYVADARIEQERILTFESVTEGQYGSFSLVPVDLPGGIRDNQLVELTEQIYRQSRERANDRLVIRSAAPNWVASTAPGQMVTGGPGATPVPTTLPSKFWGVPLSEPDTPFGFRLATSAEVSTIPGVSLSAGGARLLDEGISSRRSKAQRPVEIALLDTAPTVERIREAYAKWHKNHPLLESLLGPNGTIPSQHLRITYAADMPNGAALFKVLEDETNDALTFGVLKHLYDMSDHGLFAAGITHTLAPQASLHLVEVLNKWGVGNTETLALGLQTILNARRPEATELIINCSLTIQFPWDTRHAKDSLPPFLLKILGTKAAHRANYIERVMLPIRWILEAYQHKYPNVLVVAAAGNDGKAGNARRPLARYPAAFPDVIGAGALQSNYRFAPYSNQSDLPLNAGIATFGGNIAPSGRAHAQKGMLGIYTGDFPNPNGTNTPNANGWGRWAGTSFAAPVISGVLAARIGMGEHPDDAHSWIENLLFESGANDNIFPVKQGL